MNDLENTSEIEETVEIINDDVLNINISIEDIKDLTEEEAVIVAQKLEIEIEKYEDMLVKAEEQFLDADELKDLGFDETEYKRLKASEKAVYAHIKQLHKQVKEKGFFGALPGWAAVIGIICAIFTIIPINPYLPLLLFYDVANGIANDFIQSTSGIFLIYGIYIGIFFIVEFIALISLYFKEKKEVKKNSFKAFLVIVIINIILAAPGIYFFISSALKSV